MKRWLSFRLKTLFVVISAVSVGFGILTHRVREQRGAVEELRVLGNDVTYDFEEPGLVGRLQGRSLLGFSSPEPNSVSVWLGVDVCHNVVAVTLAGEELDATIRQLQRLRRLKTVYLYSGTCAMGYSEVVAENKRIERALPGVKVKRVTLAIVG